MDWNVDIVARLALATILGGLIGLERERMNRAAGLRTHVLVSVGSALFTILSVTAFRELGKVNDPARIAAQVVSGIGFLGAGTIMKHGATVRGLTTAATLWVVAAIGMAAGSGCYLGAVTTCAIVLASLVSLRAVERTLSDRRTISVEIVTDMRPQRLAEIQGVFTQYDARVTQIDMHEEDENMALNVTVIVPKALDRLTLVHRFKELGIDSVEISS